MRCSAPTTRSNRCQSRICFWEIEAKKRSGNRDCGLRLASGLAQAHAPAELLLDLIGEPIAAQRHTVTDRAANLREQLLVERLARGLEVRVCAQLRRVAQ